MNAVKEDVKKLVQKELESANQRFPMFRSDHEGAAVIVEEIEEAQEDINSIQRNFGDLWKSVKRNSEPEYHAESIYYCAISLACEAIQVAAMAQKFIDSSKRREDVNCKGEQEC